MDSSTVELISSSLLASFDPEPIGKDGPQRFSSAPILQLFLHRYQATGDSEYRHAVEQTLDGLSIAKPWTSGSENTPGERLSDNSAILELFAWAYLVLDRKDYSETANNIIDEIQRVLSTGPNAAPSGGIFPRATAVSALLDAAWLLNRPDCASNGLALLNSILEQVGDGPAKWDWPTPESGPDTEPFQDCASIMIGLAAAYAKTAQPSYQAAARHLAYTMVSRYRSMEEGSPSEITVAGFALGLAKLFNQTFVPEYRRAALDALNHLGPVEPKIGSAAATYALALDMLLHPPVEVVVVGEQGASPTKELLRAAVTILYPNVDVRYVDSGDQERMKDAGYGSGGDAQAYVCMDSLCMTPVSDPEALRQVVSDFLEPESSTGGDVIQSLDISVLNRRTLRN